MILFSRSPVDHNAAATPLWPDDSSYVTPDHHLSLWEVCTGFIQRPSSEHWVIIARYASQKMTFPGDTNHGGHEQTTRSCSLGKLSRPASSVYDRLTSKLAEPLTEHTVEHSFLFPLVQELLKFIKKRGSYSPK